MKKIFRLENLDLVVTTIIAIVSFCLIIYTIFKERYLYLMSGVMIFLVTLIWRFIRKDASIESKETDIGHVFYKILNISFYMFFCTAIYILYTKPNVYERPLSFFILISIMSGIIALEIFFSKDSKSEINLLLLQIIIVGLIIVFSESALFPSVIGVDPFGHQWFTQEIIEGAHISNNFDYSHLPIFHLIAACCSLISGEDYKYSTMIFISTIIVICNILLIYLLGSFVLNSYKIGLLGSLLIATANLLIYMAFCTTPNSLGFVFVIYIIYLLIKLKAKSPIIITLLILLFIITSILTHTIVSLALALILLGIFISFNFYNVIAESKDKPYFSIGLILFSTIFMLAWWTFASNVIIIHLGELIKWGFAIDMKLVTPVEGYLREPPLLEQAINYLPELVFYAFSILGCLYMISPKGNRSTFSICVVGIMLLSISFFAPLFGREILQDRWRFFSQVLLAVPAAVGIFLFTLALKNKLNVVLFNFIFISILTFFMVTSLYANIDNNFLYPNTEIRSALTESELTALKTVSETWDGFLGSDKYYSNAMIWMGYKTEKQSDISDKIIARDFANSDGLMILIRSEILEKPFEVLRSVSRLDYDLNNLLDENNYDKIYDCKSVAGFIKLEHAQ